MAPRVPGTASVTRGEGRQPCFLMSTSVISLLLIELRICFVKNVEDFFCRRCLLLLFLKCCCFPTQILVVLQLCLFFVIWPAGRQYLGQWSNGPMVQRSNGIVRSCCSCYLKLPGRVPVPEPKVAPQGCKPFRIPVAGPRHGFPFRIPVWDP